MSHDHCVTTNWPTNIPQNKEIIINGICEKNIFDLIEMRQNKSKINFVFSENVLFAFYFFDRIKSICLSPLVYRCGVRDCFHGKNDMVHH